MSRREVHSEFGHNDFARVKVKSPGFFDIVAVSEGSFLHGCLGSHHSHSYSEDWNGAWLRADNGGNHYSREVSLHQPLI